MPPVLLAVVAVFGAINWRRITPQLTHQGGGSGSSASGAIQVWEGYTGAEENQGANDAPFPVRGDADQD